MHPNLSGGPRRRDILTMLGGLATGGLLAGCGSDSTSTAAKSSNGLTTLRVAPSIIQYYIAENRGYFKKRNLAVKITDTFLAAPTLLPSLSKQYDFGLATIPDALNALAGGVQTKIIFVDTSENEKYPQSYLVADKSITSLKGLKGKTIGVIAASGSLYVALLSQLHKAGVTASDIRWVTMPADNMSDQLKAKRIHAAVIPVLNGQPVIRDTANFRVLGLPVIDACGGSGAGVVLLANTAWAEKNLTLVNDFRAAIVEATEYMNSHPAETGQAYIKYKGMKEEMVKGATAAQILSNALGLQPAESNIQSWITVMENLDMLPENKVNASDLLLPWPKGLSVAKPTDAQLNANIG
ncbi:ABC transporter substrate-binding protein [Streptomyces sp. NPDC002928]|uniref:ABC transporter substrate-binding protein n=1 Tax=Streptomyces sp. NPDC002928 TaxID=3154440 RepID=UPI0033A1EF26